MSTNVSQNIICMNVATLSDYSNVNYQFFEVPISKHFEDFDPIYHPYLIHQIIVEY